MKAKTLLKLKKHFSVPVFIVVEQKLKGLKKIKGAKFAVRSSADCEDGKKYSWAGIFESYLDVPKNQIKNKIELVKKSANSNRAKIYAQKIGYKKKIKIRVIIQEMIQGDTGVCFTDTMTFESNPPFYSVELEKLCKKVEQFMGCSQNIEWIRDNMGKFWILQSRPITK